MKTFAITNDRLAYDGYIYSYCRAENEKALLKEWINDNPDFNGCKIIKAPKNVILKYGAKYCFEHGGVYYYCYKCE